MFGQAPCWSCCVLPTCALGGRIRWGSLCWLISSYPYFFTTLSVCVQISRSILGRGAGLAAATVARQNLWQLQEIFSQLPRKLYLTLQIQVFLYNLQIVLSSQAISDQALLFSKGQMLWYQPGYDYAKNLFLNSHSRSSFCMMYYLTWGLQSYFWDRCLLFLIVKALHAKPDSRFPAV